MYVWRDHKNEQVKNLPCSLTDSDKWIISKFYLGIYEEEGWGHWKVQILNEEHLVVNI